MSTYWQIKNTKGALTEEAWVRYVEAHPILEIGAPTFRPNPFKPGELMEVTPPPTTATVHQFDKPIVTVSWAEDGSDSLVIEGGDSEEDAASAYAKAIADHFGEALEELGS